MVRAWFERLGSNVRSGVSAGTMSDHRAVFADDATPEAGTADGDAQFLFVQGFSAGLLSPKESETGVLVLELSGHVGQTISFSDRPRRLVGTVPTAQFLDGLGFTPAYPPNAALVAATSGGGEEILVVELLDPRYEENTGALTYDVRIPAENDGIDMTFGEDVHGSEHPEASYGACHLFIDDCPTYHGVCQRPNQDLAA